MVDVDVYSTVIQYKQGTSRRAWEVGGAGCEVRGRGDVGTWGRGDVGRTEMKPGIPCYYNSAFDAGSIDHLFGGRCATRSPCMIDLLPHTCVHGRAARWNRQ